MRAVASSSAGSRSTPGASGGCIGGRTHGSEKPARQAGTSTEARYKGRVPPEAVRRWLESRRVIAWAVAIGVLLSAPSLFGGFETEDWVFRSIANSEIFELPFRINLWGVDGRPEDKIVHGIVHEAKRTGGLPWFADEFFHVSFWRPLGSLTHHIDYRLFSDAPLVMHAQNLFWYGVLVGAAALLYRRLLTPPWAAGLAALLYVADDAHGHAVGWITNRGAVMAAAFATLGLLAHDRWRRDGFRAGALLSPLLLMLGLASSELALGAAGYLIAHAVVLYPAPRARRALAALSWILPVLGWAVAYRLLGHGVWRSGLYVDPWVNPLAFGRALLERGSVLLLGQLGFLPSDLHTLLDGRWAALFAVGAGLIVGLFAFSMLPVLKSDRRARFWALGMVLCVVPVTTAFAQDRLLLLVGLGGMGLVGSLLSALASGMRFSTSRRRRFALGLAGLLLVSHVVVGPLLLPARSLTMWHYENRLARARQSAFGLLEHPLEELVLVNARLRLRRDASSDAGRTRRTPGRIWICRMARSSHSSFDGSTSTTSSRSKGGSMALTFNRIYRDPARPMPASKLYCSTRSRSVCSKSTPPGNPCARVSLSLAAPKPEDEPGPHGTTGATNA